MANTNQKKRVQEAARRALAQQQGEGAGGTPPPSAPSPSFLDRVTSTVTSGINTAQREAGYALNEMSNPGFWEGLRLPGDVPLDVLSPLAPAAKMALTESPAARLLAARAFQSVNPFAAGDVGNNILEANPQYQRGAVELVDAVGDVPAAALQAGAQIAPGALVEGAAGLAARGAQAATMTVPLAARRFLQGGLTGVYTNAAQNALGAAEGKRADTFEQGLTDPTQVALSAALGGLPGAASDIMQLRAQRPGPTILADITSPVVASARRGVENAADQQRVLADVMADRQLRTLTDTNLTRPYDLVSPDRPPQVSESLDILAPLEIPTRPYPWGGIPAETLMTMPDADRARHVVQVADEMQQGMPTVVDPDMYMEVQIRTDVEDLWQKAGGKPTDGEVVIGGRAFSRAELAAQVAKGAGKELGRRLSGTGSNPDATNAVGTPRKIRQKATPVDVIPELSELRMPPNAPEAKIGLPSVADDMLPSAIVPSRNPGTPNAPVPNRYTADEALKRGRVDADFANKDTIYSPVGYEDFIVDTFDFWKRKGEEGHPLAGAGMARAQQLADATIRQEPTRRMGMVDRAKIEGESPALIQELQYGPGSRGNMGAGKMGDATKVMWNRDIRAAQDRKAGAFEATQVLTPAQVKAEIQAKLDPRTVETPGAPVTGGLPADVDIPGAALEDAKFALERMRENRNPTALQELAKKFALPEFRAGPLVGAAIRSYKAAVHIQNVQVERLFPQLRKAYKAAGPEGQKLIRRYFHQSVSPESAKGPLVPVQALPEPFRNLFQQGMEQNAFYRNDLAKAGYFSPEQLADMTKAAQVGQEWLHRDYMAMLDGTYLPKPQLLDEAIRFLVKIGKGKVSFDAARAELVNIMTGEQNAARRIQRFQASQLNKEILKGRGNIPPVIRKVLGEVHDPAYVTASTMSELERLWRQHKVSEAFTAPEYKGTIWDDKPTRNMHDTRVWDDNLDEAGNRRQFGMFAGKWVAPQLYEAILQGPAPALQSTVSRVLAWFTGAFKTAKVAMSPVTYMNNWISNSAYAAAAGLPVWNARFVPRLVQSARALKAYGDTFLTPREGAPKTGNDAQWVQWALEDGALIPGTGSEFGGSQARVIAQQFLRDPKAGIVGFLQSGWDGFQRAKAKAGSFYDALDSHWRLAVYIEQVTKARERLGLPMSQARARAARIINNNFASSGTVGQGVREMGRQVGFLAPFMTWHADNIRVHAGWLANSGRGLRPKDMAGKSIPGADLDVLSGEGSAQALNVALHYGLISGLFTALRYAYGFSDSEIAAAEAKLKQSYRQNNPEAVRQWLPWRDEKGRAQVVSLVPLFPSAMFLKGDPNRSLLSRAMTNMVLGFVQSAAAEDPVKRALASLGLGEADYRPETLPGQEGRSAVEAAWNYLEPGIIRDIRNVSERLGATEASRKWQEKYTPGQAVAAFSPLKVEPVGRQSAESERRRGAAETREMMGVQGKVNRSVMTQDEKGRVKEAARRALEERVRRESGRAKNLRQ